MTTPYYTFFFFLNDTATTEIYTLSLHDALPIFIAQEKNIVPTDMGLQLFGVLQQADPALVDPGLTAELECLLDDVVIGKQDRKSTRLNSSHSQISYAVFCLKKKKTK